MRTLSILVLCIFLFSFCGCRNKGDLSPEERKALEEDVKKLEAEMRRAEVEADRIDRIAAGKEGLDNGEILPPLPDEDILPPLEDERILPSAEVQD